jgi:transglutaminase-like putative cysteine protease
MNKIWLIIGAAVLAGVLLYITGMNGTNVAPTTQSTAWQEAYKAKVDAAGMTKYTSDTPYYDVKNKEIVAIANDIASRSSNAREAGLKVAEYVNDKVRYTAGESDTNCFDGTAPEILASGSGQCDTQSITVISILRSMGIPAAPAGGCLVFNSKCDKMALFAPGVQNSFSIDLNQTEFSRGFDVNVLKSWFQPQSMLIPGIGRYGGLHAWVMAWIDGKWTPIEATTGTYAEGNCYFYHVELYPSDAQKDDICVTKSFNYASACKYDNIPNLNTYGLGFTTNVTPGMTK